MVSLSREQIFGYIGAVLLGVGVFAPLVHVPILGSINYVAHGKGDGWFVFALALLAGGLTFFRRYRLLFIPAICATIICGWTLWQFHSMMSDLESSTTGALKNNLFAGLAQAMIASVQLEWGWALLFLGLASLFAAAGCSLISTSEDFESIADDRQPPSTAVVTASAVLLGAVVAIGGSAYVYFSSKTPSIEATESENKTDTSNLKTASPELAHMNSAVSVEVTKKSYLPSDFASGRYRDRIQFMLRVTNHSTKDIAGVKGTLEFRDMFGSPVQSVSLSMDDEIKPGQARPLSNYGMDVNQFIASDTQLANTPLSKLTVVFTPEVIVFADGSRIVSSDGASVH